MWIEDAVASRSRSTSMCDIGCPTWRSTRYRRSCQGGCTRPSSSISTWDLPYRPGNDVTFFDDYGASIRAMTAEVEQGRALRPRGVLHHGLGRGDRRRSSRPGARPRRAASRCGCSSTTWVRAASPATRTCSALRRRPASTGTRCCPSSRSRAAPPPGPAQPPQDPGRRRTRSPSSGSQNLIEPGYNKPEEPRRPDASGSS